VCNQKRCYPPGSYTRYYKEIKGLSCNPELDSGSKPCDKKTNNKNTFIAEGVFIS